MKKITPSEEGIGRRVDASPTEISAPDMAGPIQGANQNEIGGWEEAHRYQQLPDNVKFEDLQTFVCGSTDWHCTENNFLAPNQFNSGFSIQEVHRIDGERLQKSLTR